MKPTSRTVLFTLVILLFSGQVNALRCGNSLVGIGDRKHEVIRLCGDPTYTDSYDRPLNGNSYNSGFLHMDVWTYNFGKSRFIQELVFENGILRYINQLGYGY